MKITVIVPTYKPQAYLWECLDSIYNQTLPKSDYELVLVLNGCNEPYNVQINEWLTKHSKLQVQYFQIDEGGVSNARNIALDNARGEYVTFIDDDDYISCTFLKELLENSSESCVTISNTVAFDDFTKEKQKGYIVAKDFDKCLEKYAISLVDARRFFAGPVRKLIHRNIIGHRRFDIRFKNGEDTLFMFLVSDKIKQISCTSKKAIYYRRIRENSANMHKRSLLNRLSNSLNLIREYSFIYVLSPKKYDLKLYITNVLGALKTIIIG